MVNLNFDDERLENTPFFYFVNYLNVLHDNFLKANFKDISPRDFTYLSNIYYNPGISQKEMAELLYVSESNVAQIIKRLEKSGYIKREAIKSDKGRKAISLTEKGNNFFSMFLELTLEGEEHYFSEYSDEDKRKFKEMLYLFCEKSAEYEKLKYSWDHK